MRGNKHVFVMKGNSYLEGADEGSNPNSVLIKGQSQGVIYETGKGNNDINKREASLLVQIT